MKRQKIGLGLGAAKREEEKLVTGRNSVNKAGAHTGRSNSYQSPVDKFVTAKMRKTPKNKTSLRMKLRLVTLAHTKPIGPNTPKLVKVGPPTDSTGSNK